jgi:hypothetical protein
MAIGAVRSWIRNPPTLKPVNSETEVLALMALLAGNRSFFGMIVGR